MTRTLKVASRIPFIFVLLIIAGYLWLFGDFHFPEWETYYGISYATQVSYYFFLLVVFLIFSRLRDAPYLRSPAPVAGKQFLIGFVGTLVFMMVLYGVGFIQPEILPSALLIPMVLMQVSVISPAEELMFRGVLLSYVGIIASAILFAIWHGVTYGVSTGNSPYMIFVAFVFGIVMGIVAKNRELGIPATIGIHACFNLVIVGALIL